jgi:fibronectin type 3 domain-containing protein
LPPRLNIPQPVADLAAVQRGSTIFVHFTLPKLTTEGVGVKPPLHWDFRIGEAGPGEFRTEAWAESAKSPGGPRVEKGSVTYEIPAAPWVGKDVVLAVRVADAHEHPSVWSKPLALSVAQPPVTPRDVQAKNVLEGVRLTWSGAGPAYRVYRRAEGDPAYTVAANTETPEYLDRATEYGKSVRYIVQAIAKTGSGEVESDLSTEATLTPADVFPPAVPAGLTAVPTATSIELNWDRDTEPDLAGYRIYRAVPGGEFQKIGETTDAPSYSDRQMEAGKKYRYVVTAFDKAGNESKQSAEITVDAP